MASAAESCSAAATNTAVTMTRGRSSARESASPMQGNRSSSPMQGNRFASPMQGNRFASPMQGNRSASPMQNNQNLIAKQLFEMHTIKTMHLHEQDQYKVWMSKLPVAQKTTSNIMQHQNLMLSYQKLQIDALKAKHHLQKIFSHDPVFFPGLAQMVAPEHARSPSPMPATFHAKGTECSNLLAKQQSVLNSFKGCKIEAIKMNSLVESFGNLQSRDNIHDEETAKAFFNMYHAMAPNMPFLANFSFMFPKLIKDQEFLDTCLDDDRMAKVLSGSVKTHMTLLKEIGAKIMVASIINNFRSNKDIKDVDATLMEIAKTTFIQVRAEFIAIHNFPYDESKDKEKVIAQRAKADCDGVMAATYNDRYNCLTREIKKMKARFFESEEITKAEMLVTYQNKHAALLENELSK